MNLNFCVLARQRRTKCNMPYFHAMTYIEGRDGRRKRVELINVEAICKVNLHPLDCTLDCTVVLLKVRVSYDFNFSFLCNVIRERTNSETRDVLIFKLHKYRDQYLNGTCLLVLSGTYRVS